jgi:uncharacterized protein YoxC
MQRRAIEVDASNRELQNVLDDAKRRITTLTQQLEMERIERTKLQQTTLQLRTAAAAQARQQSAVIGNQSENVGDLNQRIADLSQRNDTLQLHIQHLQREREKQTAEVQRLLRLASSAVERRKRDATGYNMHHVL